MRTVPHGYEEFGERESTFTPIVPAMAHWLLSQPPTADDAHHALRHAILSPIIHAFGERFGVTMRTHYGMTEAGNVTSRRNMTDESPSCGRPRPGYEVRIVDEHDYEVPVGEVGEQEVKICVVARPGSDIDPKQLVEFLVPQMPRYDAPFTDATWDREVAGVVVPK